MGQMPKTLRVGFLWALSGNCGAKGCVAFEGIKVRGEAFIGSLPFSLPLTVAYILAFTGPWLATSNTTCLVVSRHGQSHVR